LSKEARVVWNETVALLHNMGVLTAVDGAMLEMYCRLVVEERELSTFLKKNELTVEITTKGGGTYQQLRPEATERKERRATLRQIQIQFGMSPASRARIQVEPDEKPAGVTTRNRRKA
jgi:P27 family predicted phage terminase small subunit